MKKPGKITRMDLLGYAVLLLGGIAVVRFNLVLFLLFLLFLYLLSDVFVIACRKIFSRVSEKLLLGIFYILFIALMVWVSIVVIPAFSADVPEYLRQVRKHFLDAVGTLSEKYRVVIPVQLVQDVLFQESAKTINHLLSFFTDVFKGLVYFIFALVVNWLCFAERGAVERIFTRVPDGLSAFLYRFVTLRIGRFYFFFRKVMSGQVIISAINTILTVGIVLVLGIPHMVTLGVLVFICGLLPVIGNIISNTILSITALFSRGIITCLICLGFLIGIHKLEYFLNSRIIGSIVHLPMLVTLLALIAGEALLGLPGIILAIPFTLFLKQELELLKAP